VVVVVEACGFARNLAITERADDPALDADLTESILEAPQQRVQALIERAASGA
jgi:hypothetical protein